VWPHKDYFDKNNCHFEELHLQDALDALNVNMLCEDDGGHSLAGHLGVTTKREQTRKRNKERI
jgi:hypothetical protein